MLPQLGGFIEQFNGVLTQFNANVVTDSAGNMSVHVPVDMSEKQAKFVTDKVTVIDRLINSQGSSINDIKKKGIEIEDNIRKSNPNYSSQLTDKISYFKSLNASYKH